jgi:hypothetical protein
VRSETTRKDEQLIAMISSRKVQEFLASGKIQMVVFWLFQEHLDVDASGFGKET